MNYPQHNNSMSENKQGGFASFIKNFEKAITDGYDTIESSVKRGLDSGKQAMNDTFGDTFEDVKKGVVAGYKGIEDVTVKGYKAIESATVEQYKSIEETAKNMVGKGSASTPQEQTCDSNGDKSDTETK